MEIRQATWEDLETVSTLLGGPAAASGTRLELLRLDWDQSRFEVGRDNYVVESGAVIVGYGALSPSEEIILRADDEDVADELLGRLAVRGRERGLTAIRARSLSENDPASRLVRRHPFRPESETLVMWRRLDGDHAPPVWPSGIAVRTFEPDDAPKVHRLLDDAYRAWDRNYVPMAHDDWVRWMTGDGEFDPAVWWLAERDGELAGCALHWTSGWLKDLAVREDERGQGLGSALVQHGLTELAGRGAPRVGLKVDAANPTGAVALYERLGFVTERRETVWALSL